MVRSEPELGQPKSGGIQRVRSESLCERPQAIRPAPAGDGFVDSATGIFPALGVGAQAQALGYFERPIERHPAHDLAVGELLVFAPHLPDRCVTLLPAGGSEIGDVSELGPELGRDLAAAKCVDESAIEDLAVDALVLFGATGDLAYEQIFPALQAWDY